MCSIMTTLKRPFISLSLFQTLTKMSLMYNFSEMNTFSVQTELDCSWKHEYYCYTQNKYYKPAVYALVSNVSVQE